MAEILEDAYVRNQSTPEERSRLLDHPDVVASLGRNTIEELKRTVRATA